MIIVFTVCSYNYLAQAITLGDSLLKYNPEFKFIIGLVDRKNDLIYNSKNLYEIIEVEDIGIPYFTEMVLRYNIVELNTSVKPSYFKYLFSKFNPDSIIYLDPDIQVFAQLDNLKKELEHNDIVLTPHFLTPINDDKWQAEEDFLNSGLYNLGFIAIHNTQNGMNMINWWAERLRNKAFIDFKRGLFTDQIWINFVPLFFQRVKILSNLGYNVAYWNLHERAITLKNGNYYVNDKQPLVFYHFASFRPLDPEKISTGQSRFTFQNRPDIVALFRNYCNLVFNNNYKMWSSVKCHYIEVKQIADNKYMSSKIREIPKFKRGIGKILRLIIKKYDIVMDYSTLRK